MKLNLAILLIAFACATSAASAQTAVPYTWEVGAGYNFVHSNAPPTGCGCFSMNGGTASALRQFTPRLGVEAEFSGIYNGNVNATGRSLTLLTYLAGPRYRLLQSDRRFDPYAQVLLGGSHASGGLYGSSSSPSGTANAFATSIGGGVDMKLTQHIGIRIVQVDYLLTLLSNGVNSRQNNVSVSTGFVIRFGK
jgi:outer membrane immunogenic protein